ncbi:BapA/Bap/LapF family large adhesin [Acinetobacter sp. ANC 3832]|uniref:BapA/Bap/LapF family large adhesin n=1 Tax=Acinetobacter sp. ANC 3832 TaxID=1977874 RepID=UPI000A32F451|nr:BapA/Bap/LapF family large adhesin [Acinetobacter sp. ANC 3832]OTG96526.1 hypothetical protein B9T35_02355 [Acinetobacter sp. ANC 3832]
MSTNEITSSDYKSGTKVTLVIRDAITNNVLDTVVMQVAPNGSFTYTTDQFINGEIVTISGTNKQNLPYSQEVTLLDFKAPDAPTAVINGQGTSVTGHAESGSTVKIKDANDQIIGSAIADVSGNYQVTLNPAQANGQDLKVTATDPSQNESDPTAVHAPDITPPEKPTDVVINDAGTVVTGKAEPKATIEVKDPAGNVIGTGTTDASGNFTVNVNPAQNNGQTLDVTATDAAHNPSAPAEVVANNMAPVITAAVVDPTTGASIVGKVSETATIVVKDAAGNILGTGTTDANGNFTVSLNPAQNNGEHVFVTATDTAPIPKQSEVFDAQGKDNTAPNAPTDLAVVDGGTTVTGKAEPKSTIEVKDAAGQVIGTGTTDTSGNFAVTVAPKQANGEDLTVNATDASGNKSPDAPVHAPDITAPNTPTDLAVVDGGTTVTGKAEPNSKVEVKDPTGQVIGTGTTDASGNFAVTVAPKQANGEDLAVNATDASGNKSPDAPVHAPDITAPNAPTNLAVVDGGTTVTGKAEPNSKVEVKDPAGQVIGTGTTDASGNFAVTVSPKQANGEDLTVNATDASGNKSPDAPVHAPDITAPDVPTDLAVVNGGTTVTGKAEPNSKVEVKDPTGHVIGTGTADASGNFAVTVAPKQANGEDLTVNATDVAGNKSPDAPVHAPDITAPEVNNLAFNSQGTQVTGTSEPNAQIEVKDVNGNVIGRATTGADGKFTVDLGKVYGAGQLVNVTGTDAAGNTSVPKSVNAPMLLQANNDVVHADIDLGFTTTSSKYTETKSFGSVFKFLGIPILGCNATEINFNVGDTQKTNVDIKATNFGFASLFDAVKVTLYKQNDKGNWEKVASNTDVGLFNKFFLFFPEQARIKTGDLAQGNYKIIAEDLTLFSFLSVNSLNVTYDTVTKSANLEALKANVVSGNVMSDDVTTAGTTVTKIINSDGKSVDVSATGSTTLVGKFGTMLIKADGSYSYTPNKDASVVGKVDAFSYTIKDQAGNTSQAKVYVQIGSDEVKVEWDPTDPSKSGTMLHLYNDFDVVKSTLVQTTSQSSVNSGTICTSFNKSAAVTSNIFKVDANSESTIKVAFKAAFAKSLFGGQYSTTQDPDDTTFKWQLQKYNDKTGQWENVTGANGSKYFNSTFSNSVNSGNELLSAEVKVTEAGQYRVNFNTSTGWGGWSSNYDTSIQVTTQNHDSWTVNNNGTASGNIFTGVGVETANIDALGIGSKLSISTDGGATFKAVATSGTTVQGLFGSLTIQADGTYSYAQKSSAAGTEDFVYKVTNSNGETATAHLNIAFEQTIQGSAGADTFTADSVMHVLQMGAGADIVKFTALNSVSGHGDTWTDFSKAEGDKIDIQSLLSGKGVTAQTISQYVTVEQDGNNSIVKIDLDGKGAQYTPQELVILQNNHLNLDDLLQGNHLVF